MTCRTEELAEGARRAEQELAELVLAKELELRSASAGHRLSRLSGAQWAGYMQGLQDARRRVRLVRAELELAE